jgi:hypothetical protein
MLQGAGQVFMVDRLDRLAPLPQSIGAIATD